MYTGKHRPVRKNNLCTKETNLDHVVLYANIVEQSVFIYCIFVTTFCLSGVFEIILSLREFYL